MNAVVHGTGFIRIATNGPKGLELSVVPIGDYRYIMEEPPQRTLESLTDEEIQKALGVTSESSNWNMIMVLEWAKKIEAALLEKNK